MYMQTSTLEDLGEFEQQEYQEWLDMIMALGGPAEEQDLVAEDDYDDCPDDEDMEDCRHGNFRDDLHLIRGLDNYASLCASSYLYQV